MWIILIYFWLLYIWTFGTHLDPDHVLEVNCSWMKHPYHRNLGCWFGQQLADKPKLCFSNKLRCGLISQSYFFVFVLVKGGEFHLDFWILLVPKMVISKLSGNTVRSTHPRLQKTFWYMTVSLENWLNWHNIKVLTSISLNLTPSSINLVKFEAWSFIKRFTAALAKFSRIRDDLRSFVLKTRNMLQTGGYRGIELPYFHR